MGKTTTAIVDSNKARTYTIYWLKFYRDTRIQQSELSLGG
jgi:hypothetical protein